MISSFIPYFLQLALIMMLLNAGGVYASIESPFPLLITAVHSLLCDAAVVDSLNNDPAYLRSL